MKKQPTVVICLSPYSGGMELDAIKLAKKLSSYSEVVMIAKSGYFVESKQDEYVGFNNIKLETISFKSNLGFSIIINVRRVIKEYGIKNVIFFGASELKSLYFAFWGVDINLIVRHGTTKSTPKKDWFHRLIYSNVNYHVSICRHLFKNVRDIIPFGKDTKDRVIYSSYNTKKIVHIKQNRLTLLHIGRIASGKGQIDAIKACDILVQNGVDFVFNIVGGYDEIYKDEFLNFYNQCLYKDKINIIGFVDDIEPYLQKSDIFLFPSYGEGLSNAFLEAISYNMVCLTYNNTSFPELQDLGLNFHMADNLNVVDLKNKLLYISKNIEQERNKLQNSKFVKEFFSFDKEITSYLDILK